MILRLELIVLTLCLFCTATTIQAEPLPYFFDNDESTQLALTSVEWDEDIKQLSQTTAHLSIQPYSDISLPDQCPTRPDGPLVTIINPEARGLYYEAHIPVKLLIYLKSYIAPIDIESLAIHGKRGIFSLDITDRLKPYMRTPVQGENADYVIEGEISNLRKGRYKVLLSLADTNGNCIEKTILLKVSQGS